MITRALRWKSGSIKVAWTNYSQRQFWVFLFRTVAYQITSKQIIIIIIAVIIREGKKQTNIHIKPEARVTGEDGYLIIKSSLIIINFFNQRDHSAVFLLSFGSKTEALNPQGKDKVNAKQK